MPVRRHHRLQIIRRACRPACALALAALLPILPDARADGLHRASFNNGVQLVVEEDHAAPVATVQIWLKVGGRDETPGKTGLAHVFEHMMFKGSDKLAPGEFSRRIAAMGGTDNAFTTHDYTAYFEIVPSSQVEKVIGMEAERFAHLRLDAADFSKEIRVIQEERRMRTEDDPNSRLFEEMSAVALRLHPYRNPVIGWMQDLKRLTIEDVRAFYREHYVPANVTVVVVGDVDFARVKQAVARSFGRLPARSAPPRFDPAEPEPLGPKRLSVRLPAASPLVAVVLPVPVWRPGENDKEVAALAVATWLLAGGRGAMLQRRIVDEQRKAFAVSAGYDPFGMGLDLWYAYGMLGNDQSPEDFEGALWRTVAALAEHGPRPERLRAAIRNMVASEVFARDSLYLRAKEIGRLEAVGIGADRREDWLRAVRGVTAADVKRVLARWIVPSRATTGVLKPLPMARGALARVHVAGGGR